MKYRETGLQKKRHRLPCLRANKRPASAIRQRPVFIMLYSAVDLSLLLPFVSFFNGRFSQTFEHIL
ncbi:MAG: hypothetical protein II439_04460, partial [Firmicutes bacterium]|nr:hypothetical protein [Bacillota bacterium]